MIVFRIAAMVAALVTVTLNAAYGFKTSTVLEYAILFAALNAALDIAKCSCLVGASRAWQARQWLPATLLFLLFWPLLANSLWCGLSEVTVNRAAESTRYTTDIQSRQIATADHKRASDELTDLETSQPYRSSTACALPRTSRERTLCEKHADATMRLRQAGDTLAHQPAHDPAPQISLLASLTGFELPALLLAAAFWPVALAELCGSVGFYLTSRRGRTGRRSDHFEETSPALLVTTPETVPPAPSRQPRTPTTVHWPTITT
jgi:hypothetical protein